MVSLQEAVRLLGSDKIRERNDGIDLYRQIFQDDRAIRQLNEADEDGQRWLRALQALFNCVIVERSACLKKGSDWRNAASMTIKRLKDAARAVHWLIERVHTHLPQAAFDAAFDHVTQMLDYRNRLFEPLALDYLKALRLLVSHVPHLEHLEEEQWETAVSLCFNVVLDDRLKTRLTEMSRYETQLMDLSRDDDGQNESVKDAESDEEDADELEQAESEGRRKGRLEDIEVMACIQKLVASPYAPLLIRPRDELLGVSVLAKYMRFFAALQNESSAHLPALIGVNHVLDCLELNDTRAVGVFARKIWSDLLPLFSTKHKIMKEQLVIAYSTLSKHVDGDVGLFASLYASLSSDCEQRWGVQPLSPSAYDFRLAHDATMGANQPFQYSSFRAGCHFSSVDAVAWLAQELSADIVHASMVSATPTSTSSSGVSLEEEPEAIEIATANGSGRKRQAAVSATQQSRSKRRRVDGPALAAHRRPWEDALARIASLEGDHADHSSRLPTKAGRIWAIQAVTMLFSRHGHSLQLDAQLQVSKRLIAALSDGDHEAQSAALVCAASMACAPGEALENSVWQQLWTIACRRMQIADTSRAAAHAANAILVHQLVARETLLADCYTILSELDVQGPTCLSDSVCRFISSALGLIASDAMLANRNLEDGVLAWLQTNWTALSLDSKGVHTEGLDHSDAVDLLMRVCSLPQTTTVDRRMALMLLPDCAAVRYAQREGQVGTLRTFLRRSELPPSRREKEPEASKESNLLDESSTQTRPASARESRAMAMLSKLMRAVESAWEGNPTQSVSSSHSGTNATSSSQEKLKRSLDFVLQVLVFVATLSMNGVSTTQAKSLAASATTLLASVIELAAQPHRSSTCRAYILVGLGLVLPLSNHDGDLRKKASGMEEPGPLSGVPQEIINRGSQRATEIHVSHDDELMIRCWSMASMTRVLESLQALRKVLSQRSEEQVISWADNNSGPFQEADDSLQDGLQNGKAHTRLAMWTCISAVVNIARYSRESDPRGALADPTIIEAMLDGDVGEVLLLAEATCPQISSRRLRLNPDFGNQLLERFASDLLASYDYERNEEAQLCALGFLEATMEMWAVKTTTTTGSSKDFVKNAQKLLAYFRKQLSRSQLSCLVSMRVNVLLERYLAYVSSDTTLLSTISTLAPESIVDTLLIAVTHDDVRTRFAAATMSARLFSYWSDLGFDATELYSKMQKALPADTTSWERMQTRIMLLGNVVVATSAMRYLALWHLLELTIFSSEFQSSTRSVLSAASTRLGYVSLPDFWLVFASHLTWAMLRNSMSLNDMPFAVLGYKSKEEYARHSFLPVASMLLAVAEPASVEAFRNLAKLVHRSEKEGAMTCIPFLVATEIGFVETDTTQSSQDPDSTAFKALDEDTYRTIYLKTIAAAAIKLSLGKGFEGLVSDRMDGIVTALVCQFYESDLAKGAFLEALQQGDPTCGSLLAELTTNDKGLSLHEPNRPMWNATTFYRAIRALTNSANSALDASTIYSVIIDIADVISRELTVNDQLRHLQGLKVYLAMAQETITKEPMLLRLILKTAIALAAQNDLYGTVWPLVEWTLRATSSLPRAFPGLSQLFVSLFDLRRYREDLTELLEPLLSELLQSEITAGSVTQALFTWSEPLPDSISSLVAEPRLDSLVDFLHADQDCINVAILRRILTTFQRATDETVKQRFSSTTIWKLLAALKKRQEKRGEEDESDALVVADIIFACKGQLHNPGVKDLLEDEAESPLCQAVQELQTFKAGDVVRPLKGWLIVQLMDVVHSKNLSRARTAADCLREILSQKLAITSWQERWPDLVRGELDALSTFAAATAVGESPQKRKWAELNQSLDMAKNFEAWICWFSSFLCDTIAAREGKTSAFHALSKIVCNDSALASSTMQVLLHILLRLNLATVEERPQATQIATYFSFILQRIESTSKEVWSAILKAIIHLRKDAPTEFQMSGDLWLPGLDFLLLAERAIDCKLYTSSLLFVELAREHRIPAIDDRERILALQYQIYSNVDDPDGFYGIRDPDVGQSLVKRLQHEGEWQRAFELRGAEFESLSPSAAVGFSSSSLAEHSSLTACLHHMGLNKLAAKLGTSSEAGANVGYDTAWRVGMWTMPVTSVAATAEYVPHLNLYAALRAHHRERTASTMNRTISTSLRSQLSNLSRITVEANASARNLSRELLGLRETKRWQIHRKIGESLDDEFDFDDSESIISVRLSLLRSAKERLGRQQIGDVLDSSTKDNVELERSLLLDLSRRARERGNLTASINAVTQARQLQKVLDEEEEEEQDLSSSGFDIVGQEFATVLWTQGEHAMAIEALAAILQRENTRSGKGEKANRNLHASALARLGQWRATARSHPPKVIDEECFKPALALFNDGNHAPEKAKVCYQFAVFADEQYRALVASEEVSNLEAFVGHRREEIAQIQLEMQKAARQSERYQQLHIARRKAEKIATLDQAKLREYETAKDQFRLEAAEMYATALATSDNVDEAAVRLTSLWFENSDLQELNEKLGKHLAKVPSAKFLPLTHQISSRLNKPNASPSSSKSPSPSPLSSLGSVAACSAFLTNINGLVFRMCKDHPFHTLYALYALAMGAQEAAREEATRGKAKKRSSTTGTSTTTTQDANAVPPSTQVSRGSTAEEIIDRVRASSSPAMQRRIDACLTLCRACREWAQLKLDKAMPNIFEGSRRGGGGVGSIKKGYHPVPPALGLMISKLRNVEVPMITRDLPVDPTGRYETYVGIARYSSKFTTAGGIHLPKIIDCIGTDGRAYRQLYKDKDDLRQDAVMQQVFRLVNGLLERDQRAKRRRLTIRTYQVIPLGPQFGLLEFVGSTKPIQEPLLDTHSRYRDFTPSFETASMEATSSGRSAAAKQRHALTPLEARSLISAAAGKDTRERVAVFKDVCARMPPTFRLYFFEKYTDPMAWFGARLNYTRSVATTSIVGHVLGLGDRHVSNILLDQVSGEVVHIDFGVAFDQGRLLPIPELVPFRLTRDMVDGMGSTGVEGVFRSSAQETLRVLREARPIIKTVLEVFKYDPLFDWTQNPVKVLRAQAAGVVADEQDAITNSSASSNSTLYPPPTPLQQQQQQQQQRTGQTKETAELQAERAINSVMTKLGNSLSVEYTVNDLIQRATDTTNLACIFHGWQAAL